LPHHTLQFVGGYIPDVDAGVTDGDLGAAGDAGAAGGAAASPRRRLRAGGAAAGAAPTTPAPALNDAASWPWTSPAVVPSPTVSPTATTSVSPVAHRSAAADDGGSGSGGGGGAVSPSPSTAPRPVAVDWADPALGVMTPIRNQGGCGACFAFAAAAALEAAAAIEARRAAAAAGGPAPAPPTPLAEQQILDCGEGTCGGWGVRSTWNYVRDAGGLCAGAEYPYSGAKAETCPVAGGAGGGGGGGGGGGACPGGPIATVSGYRSVIRGSAPALEYAVSVSPVVVPLKADADAFRFYAGGVLGAPACGGTAPNHAAVVVGYGTDPATGEAFWKLKNSWGEGWGEGGFIRLARGGAGGGGDAVAAAGACGVLSDPTMPVWAAPRAAGGQ
jgi:hypothetical protein